MTASASAPNPPSHQPTAIDQDTSTSTRSSIYELLYTEWNAAEILNGREIPFYKILGVSIPDQFKPQVVIQYDRHHQTQELPVMATEFYFLHYQRRLDRTRDYTVKHINDTQWEIQSQVDPTKPAQLVTRIEEGLNCSCPDYGNQDDVVREHWWLWQFIGGQAQCKHIQAFMLDQVHALHYTGSSVDPANPPKEYCPPDLGISGQAPSEE